MERPDPEFDPNLRICVTPNLDSLIRVHRNALARKTAIVGIGKEHDGFSLLFKNSEKRLPISRRRVTSVRKVLGI